MESDTSSEDVRQTLEPEVQLVLQNSVHNPPEYHGKEEDDNFWINGRHPIEFCESEIIEEEGEVILPLSDMSQNYKCCYCSFMGTVAELQAHTKSVHLARRRLSNLCRFCLSSFESETALKLHISQEHAFHCSRCNKNFKERKLLLDHINVHNEEKCKKCSICNKTFSTDEHLLKHLSRHEAKLNRNRSQEERKRETNEKRKSKGKINPEDEVSCPFCQKVFKRKVSLWKHKIIHTRTLKCTDCDFTTNKKMLLKMHKGSHTGDRKHKCNQCSYSFNQISHLKRHIIKRHQELEEGLNESF